MDKPIEQLRVLVCGYSEAHYPRDETILAALRNLPLKRLYDLRVADDFWVKRHSGQTDAQNRKDEVAQPFSWKKPATWKRIAIRSLILSRQVDVVLVMKWNEAFLPEIWEWAERSHIPVIYDLWVSRYILAQRDQKGEAYWRKTEARIIKKCDRLLALTPPYQNFYVETYGCPAEKIAVLPLAVDDVWLKQPIAPAKPDSERLSVTYWGNVHKHHGVEVALEAARQLQAYPQIQFRFYGSFKMQALLQQIEPSYESLSNVKFPGWVKGQTELIQTVDQADLCFGHLLPSHDGHLVLPNKAMEGMARGKVVLHVDSDSMRSLYTSEVSAVHFFSGGAEGLAKAILQLAQSDSLRQAIATQARQRIWTDHSVAAISTKLEKLLTSLISL